MSRALGLALPFPSLLEVLRPLQERGGGCPRESSPSALPLALVGEGRRYHPKGLAAPQLPDLTCFPDLQGTEPRQLPCGGDTSSLRVNRSLFKSTHTHCRALQ